MIKSEKKLFYKGNAVEFFIKDLVGEIKVDDIFVQRMVPMVRSIYDCDVPIEKRESLMETAMGNILQNAMINDLKRTARKITT
ncbi:MAG: hypothetical protein GY847_10010 [Proteobacteria bacterium]|nr:hypothetical protein [Pseudomonadota bacterium]